MKRRGWSPQEEGELDAFCAEAHTSAGKQSERIDALVELLERGRGTGARWVRAIEAEAWRMMAGALLRDWAAARQAPLVAVTPDGRRLTKARTSSTTKHDDDGAEYTVQELFDFKTWDELTEELGKVAQVEASLAARERMIARLLQLHDEVPTAANPHEALVALGIDMQAWLDGEAAA